MAMYFCVELIQPELANQIALAATSLFQSQPGGQINIVALVDGAFDERLLTKRRWSHFEQRSLYYGTPLDGFGRAAPHLLLIPPDIDRLEILLQELIAACNGKPMLSFLSSALDIDELQRHFRPLLIAKTIDLTEWPLRWGDTRVLPGLIDTIDPVCRQHLLSPLYQWWSFQRNGSLMTWMGQGLEQSVPAEFEKLPLSDKAFSTLIDQAEADAVLADLHDKHPDLIKRHSPSVCHSLVSTHLRLASANGIQAAGARQHFSLLALGLKAKFSDHPAMGDLLRRTRDGGDYFAEIRALPPSFWQDAGSALVTTHC